jgi:anti-sigma factor RsiW
MHCVDTETLAMYLKNELDGHQSHTVTAHLRTCRDCTQRLGTFQHHDTLLNHALYRGQDAPALAGCACYNPEDISAYVTGHLPIQETQELERHLQTCDTCLSDVMAAHKMWHVLQRENREAPPPHLVAAVQHSIRGKARTSTVDKLGSLIVQVSAKGLRFLEAALVPAHVQMAVAGYALPAGMLRETQPDKEAVSIVEMQQIVRDLSLILHVIHEEHNTVMLRLQLRKQGLPLARQRVVLSNPDRRLYSRLTSVGGDVAFQRLSHGIYTIAIPQENVETACVLCPDITRQTS